MNFSRTVFPPSVRREAKGLSEFLLCCFVNIYSRPSAKGNLWLFFSIFYNNWRRFLGIESVLVQSCNNFLLRNHLAKILTIFFHRWLHHLEHCGGLRALRQGLRALRRHHPGPHHGRQVDIPAAHPATQAARFHRLRSSIPHWIHLVGNRVRWIRICHAEIVKMWFWTKRSLWLNARSRKRDGQQPVWKADKRIDVTQRRSIKWKMELGVSIVRNTFTLVK